MSSTTASTQIRTDPNNINYKIINQHFMQTLLNVPQCDRSVILQLDDKSKTKFCQIIKLNLVLEYFLNNNFLIDEFMYGRIAKDESIPLLFDLAAMMIGNQSKDDSKLKFNILKTCIQEPSKLINCNIDEARKYGLLVNGIFNKLAELIKKSIIWFKTDESSKVKGEINLREKILNYDNKTRNWFYWENRVKLVLLCLGFES